MKKNELPLRERLSENEYFLRYKAEPAFRTQLDLFFPLIFNLGYASVKLVLSVLYQSFWQSSIAVFYGILAVMRYYALRQLSRKDRTPATGWRTYHAFGWLLLAVSLVFSVLVIQMVYQNRGFHYPGIMVYGAAVYTACCLITAIVKLVRYRRFGDPLITAAKTISLAGALMALLALQTALFASFGPEGSLRAKVNALTGGLICTFLIFLSIRMLVVFHRQAPPKWKN